MQAWYSLLTILKGSMSLSSTGAVIIVRSCSWSLSLMTLQGRKNRNENSDCIDDLNAAHLNAFTETLSSGIMVSSTYWPVDSILFTETIDFW